MGKRHLRQAEVDAFPTGAVWNAFVDLLATTEAADLDPVQLPAYHAFWYDSEVQNGGHLQYFLNRGMEEAKLAVTSLRSLSALPQAEILGKALSGWLAYERESPRTAEEYLALEVTEDALSQLDDQYYSATPTLTQLLQSHLDTYQSRFVVIDP